MTTTVTVGLALLIDDMQEASCCSISQRTNFTWNHFPGSNVYRELEGNAVISQETQQAISVQRHIRMID